MNILNRILLRSHPTKNLIQKCYLNHQGIYSNFIGNRFCGSATWKSAQNIRTYECNLDEIKQKLNSFSTNNTAIDDTNAENNLVNFLKQNEIQSRNDAIFFINSIWFLLKLNYNVNEIIKKTISEEDFKAMLTKFGTYIDQMTIDEAILSMIVLRAIDIPLFNPILRELTVLVSRKSKELDEIPLQSLVYLAIFAKQNDDQMYPYFLCADATSHILKHLNQCQNINDLYQITIYLESIHKITTREIMTLHKLKMKEIMVNLDTKTHIKELISIITFYTNLFGVYYNSRIIKNLLLLVTNQIPYLSNEELQFFANIKDIIREPRSIVPRILAEAESRPNKTTDINLLYCRSATYLPDDVKKVSADILAYIKSIDSKDIIKNKTLNLLFNFKRHLDISEIMEVYWKKVAEHFSLLNLTESELHSTLAILTNRYCLSNKTLNVETNSYYEFHKSIIDDIFHGSASVLPRLMSRHAKFILSYAPRDVNHFATYCEQFTEKIENMAPTFNANDIIDIAAGLDQCYQNELYKIASQKKAFQVINCLNRIKNTVTECIERLLQKRNTNQIDGLLSLIQIHTLTHRARKPDRTLDNLFKSLEYSCMSGEVIITPHTIDKAVKALLPIAFVSPKLAEIMLNYVNENKDTIGADNAVRILYYLFCVGFEPNREMNILLTDGKNSEKQLNSDFFNFENFIQIINRDFDLMSSWSIIQACLALSFYQALTLDLIKRVFNMDFIQRLEKDLATNYNKRFYPKNILTMFMSLNRAVCLDYPEAAIPWFQQNFIEAQVTAFSPQKNKSAYFNDIYDLLLKLVGGDEKMIRINHVTPYGYRIPFVIYFNSCKQLVSPPIDEGPQILNKVAILPLTEGAYCINKDRRIRGNILLEERHLGILGYDVVQICHREWNSMHMNLPGARENLLRNFLKKYKLLIE